MHYNYGLALQQARRIEEAEATLAETRKDYLAELTRVPLLIIDDLGMRKLPHTAAEDLLELIEWLRGTTARGGELADARPGPGSRGGRTVRPPRYCRGRLAIVIRGNARGLAR